MSQALLSTEQAEAGILVVTITRPERRNALSSNTLVAMHREIDRIAGDPSVRVVVLTGEGTGFCAGADMKSGPEDSDDLAGVPGAELLRGVTDAQSILEEGDNGGVLGIGKVPGRPDRCPFANLELGFKRLGRFPMNGARLL